MEIVPPGFRFHPTEEELVGYYLQRKVKDLKIDLDVITDIDLYRMEPWDIEGKCKLGYEEQSEWYFFSHKDRKYPTGTRTNRATDAGFWKATGRDKAVMSKERLIGMRKTLVFYKGRAPNGMKSDWIMHEYRLQTSEHGPPLEEGWVVCRAFKKPTPNHMQGFRSCNNGYYIRDNYRLMSYPSTSNIKQTYDALNNQGTHFQLTSKTLNSGHNPFESQIVELPKLDSPSFSTSVATNVNEFEYSLVASADIEGETGNFVNQHSDWKSFDKLLGSQVFGESSSFEYTNMALETQTDDLDSQNQLNNVLECFPHHEL